MGIKKTLLYAGGLLLATGGPITFFSGSDMLGRVKRSWSAGPSAAIAAPQQPTAADASTQWPATAPPNAASTASAPADATPMPTLEEVLRFDVTVEWVMQRWPRVSTGLPYPQLQGYRVTLVTGTRITDLAGSLTYYFGAAQQVQRITLRGATGDPRALVALLTSRYRFTRRLTNDPGIVLYESVGASNEPIGTLKIRSAAVVKASQPYTRYQIDLVMDRVE